MTPAEWAAVLEEHGYRCFYCGIQLHSAGGLQREHTLPRSRGGADDRGNVVPACGPCNGRKGPRTIEEHTYGLRHRGEQR